MSKLLVRQAPLFKSKPKPSSVQSRIVQKRPLMSNRQPFFSRERNPWTRIFGSPTLLQRAYHSSPSAFHPGFRSANRVVWTLIGINTAVFGAWQVAEATRNHDLSAKLHKHAKLSQANLDAGRYHTFITSAFSHQDPFHFFFNMVALSSFGGIAARFGIGGAHMIMLALGSAITSSYAMHYQRTPRESSKKASSGIWDRFGSGRSTTIVRWEALGASGMVMGMGATATLLAPMTPMLVLFVPAPLFVVMAGYVALDTYFLPSKTSRVGHAAHLGGLVFGAVYYFTSLRNFGGVWQMVRRGLRR